MKITLRVLCATVLMFGLLSLGSCVKKSSEQDRVISVESNDPEMVSAIAKARKSLPEFWLMFDYPPAGVSNFALKYRITDKGEDELFWMTDLSRKDGQIFGKVGNDPVVVSNVRLGQEIEILEERIADWLYFRNDKMVGNETIKALFKEMDPEEVEQMKSMMENP